jgi:EpsD family peptidyl-prolyl cis-trans isomerase
MGEDAMKRSWMLAAIVVACLSAAACDRLGGGDKGKAPSGQVVATVDGEEITMRELKAELGSATFADGKTRKAAEQAALQSIVARKVLARAAERQKLDQDPDFALLKERALEMTLVQALQNNIAKDVPASSREEAERYMSLHPDVFAERKIIAVEQVRTIRPNDQIIEQMRPLNTLEEVEQLLSSAGIPYQRGNDILDAVGSDPATIESVVKLKPGEVFAIPNGNLLMISRIKAIRVVPFTGEPAIKYAMETLRRRHVQETIGRSVNGLINEAQSKIKYSKEYQPPAPKAAASPPPAAPPASAPPSPPPT